MPRGSRQRQDYYGGPARPPFQDPRGFDRGFTMDRFPRGFDRPLYDDRSVVELMHHGRYQGGYPRDGGMMPPGRFQPQMHNTRMDFSYDQRGFPKSSGGKNSSQKFDKKPLARNKNNNNGHKRSQTENSKTQSLPQPKRQRTQSEEVTSTCNDTIMEKLHSEKFEDGSWLDDIAIKDLDLKTFVLRSLEKRMEDVWPQPKSLFYCRICNYVEYTSQELLDRHTKSARHLDFQRHYNEAFCIECQQHAGDMVGMEKHLSTQQHKEVLQVVNITKTRASLYYKRKLEIQKNILTDDDIKMVDQSKEEHSKHNKLEETSNYSTNDDTTKKNSDNTNEINNKSKNTDETITKYVSSDKTISTNVSVNKTITESVSLNMITKENENKNSHLQDFKVSPESKDKKLFNDDTNNKSADIHFSGLRFNRSLIEQNKALLKKVDTLSESLSSYCSKPSSVESLLEKNKLLQKSDDKSINNEKNKDVVSVDNINKNESKEKTEQNSGFGDSKDKTENTPVKSKITELIENRRKEELEKEKKEKEAKEKELANANKFDDFIVPLTGYMCTVCHQTLDDDEEANKHMYGYQHQKNVEFHKTKYSL